MPPRAAWCVWSCKRQRRCGARGDRPRPRHSGGGTRACAQALSARRRRGLGERQRPRARAGGRDRQAASCRIHFDYVQGGQRRARTANLSATRRRHRVMAATILIIEDDASMRAGLRDNLEVEGYRVVTASSVREGREQARHAKPDLILLDVMLPDGDGVSLCRSLRSEGLQQPIIKLTARGGATACIVTVGRPQIDFRRHLLLRDGIAVETSAKEFELLRYLVSHRGEVVSREVLLSEVWGRAREIATRTVDNFVVRLREKVEIDPAEPRYLITVHGSGYKLVEQ